MEMLHSSQLHSKENYRRSKLLLNLQRHVDVLAAAQQFRDAEEVMQRIEAIESQEKKEGRQLVL